MAAFSPVTFTFTPAEGNVVTITLKYLDMGNEYAERAQQVIGETIGGSVYVYDRGVRRTQLTWSFANVSPTLKAGVDRFFDSNNVDMALRWFKVTFEPSSWEVIRAGAAVSGTAIKAGSTYTAGERILQDTIIHHVRLLVNGLVWVEQGPRGSLYALDMQLEVLDLLPLPGNPA